MAKRRERTIDESIALISGAIEQAKARTIRRIVKRLQKMAPKDVQALERLIGGARW